MATGVLKVVEETMEDTLTSEYAANLFVRRIGDFKILHIGTIGTDTGLSTQNYTVICTLPPAYRPHWKVQTKGTSNAMTTLYPFLIEIETDGTVSIYNYSTNQTHIAIAHDFIYI